MVAIDLSSSFIIMFAPVKKRGKWRSLSEGIGGSLSEGIGGNKPAARAKTWPPCVDRGTQPSVGFKVPTGEVKST
jgi:hypothetical protein